MMRMLWRIGALLLLLISGLLILTLFYRLLSQQHQHAIKRAWSRTLLAACGISLDVHGPQGLPRQPVLIAMNHVSWLDIFALNAVLPATFIAKSEIRRWPLLGWLVAGAGTVFIERGSRHAVRHANHRVVRQLTSGESVAFFPEGTTSDGDDVLPFHTSLFAAAIHDHAINKPQFAVLPVAIMYHAQGARTTVVAYTGEQSLMDSIVRITSSRGIVAQLQLLPLIEHMPPQMTRHALAAQSREAIRAAIQSPPLAAPSRLG